MAVSKLVKKIQVSNAIAERGVAVVHMLGISLAN